MIVSVQILATTAKSLLKSYVNITSVLDFHISDTSQEKSEMVHFIYQSGFGDKVYRLLADWRIPVITTIEDRRHGALLMQKRTAPPG